MKLNRRIIIIFLLFASSLLLCCCKDNSINMHSTVDKILKKEGILNSKITKLCDYKKMKETISSPTINEQEFEKEFEENHEGEVLTDEYIFSEYGFSSLSELRESEYEDYVSDLEVMQVIDKRNEVLEKMIDESVFELDEADVNEYAKGVIYGYNSQALMYNYLDVNMYAKEVLGLEEDEFLELVLLESEYDIKTLLVMGAIAEKEKMSITESDNAYEDYQDLQNDIYNMLIEIED